MHNPQLALRPRPVKGLSVKTFWTEYRRQSEHAVHAGPNICEKLPGTDRSGEARRAESGGSVLEEGSWGASALPPATDMGSTVSSHSVVWGAVPAEIEFGAF